jgi:hypothetical protein
MMVLTDVINTLHRQYICRRVIGALNVKGKNKKLDMQIVRDRSSCVYVCVSIWSSIPECI